MRALQLRRRGWRQRAIAAALGVSEAAVSKWCRLAREAGIGALHARARPGGPARLTEAQMRLIPDFLWHGAEAYGFRGEVWTCARVGQVIMQEFGISYHRAHVSRLLKRLDWTPQKPITRATQRNDAEIERWRAVDWPAIKKKPFLKDEKSSLSMSRDSTCCQDWCAHMLPEESGRWRGSTRPTTTCRL